ncbi:hypothetical protein NGM99_15410 [Mesorhizobium sp. RP14(2022)]|uniref:Phage tail protein n=1 Tax=Mesorhizobium liriopis TaxID=2953882 RepID=A0ABT1C8R4_9HYPH|nr:hypothetical protein [Mesorhizobium liriopis]MCO6051172.1 hypothetical protein [Mesorhizobium liriopis]
MAKTPRAGSRGTGASGSAKAPPTIDLTAEEAGTLSGAQSETPEASSPLDSAPTSEPFAGSASASQSFPEAPSLSEPKGDDPLPDAPLSTTVSTAGEATGLNEPRTGTFATETSGAPQPALGEEAGSAGAEKSSFEPFDDGEPLTAREPVPADAMISNLGHRADTTNIGASETDTDTSDAVSRDTKTATSSAHSSSAGSSRTSSSTSTGGTFGGRSTSSYTPPPPAPERGKGGLFLAGLLGGVAALALGAALQFAGLLSGPRAQGDAALTQLRSEVAVLRNAQGQNGAVAGEIQSLRGELAQLRESGNAVPEAIEERLGALETRVNDAAQQAQQGASTESVNELAQRVAANQALANQATEAANAAGNRVATVEQSVSEIQGRLEALGQQPKVALAIAASGLKSAADRGAPFEAELQTLRAVSPNLQGTEALDPFAKGGVPTREALKAEWDEAANAMIASEQQEAPADAGVLDRLSSSMRGLVSVRPVGNVQGTGTGPTVARMEVAVENGNLQAALAEYDTLPEPAKAAGKAFADKMRARVEIEQLIDATIANAMKAS